MSTGYASRTPEFWSHHAMLDALWDKWQKKGSNYINLRIKQAEILNSFIPVEYSKFYIDNKNLAGCGIKVAYQDVLPKPLSPTPADYKHNLLNYTNPFPDNGNGIVFDNDANINEDQRDDDEYEDDENEEDDDVDDEQQ